MAWPGFTPEQVRTNSLSAERFMSCCDQIWSTDRRSTHPVERMPPVHGSLVYAKRDHARTLFGKLKKKRSKIVLVTSESDDCVAPGEPLPPQVETWFSSNSSHPGVQSLPLGLGNSYCNVTAKADLLADFSERPKTSLLYVNFRPETNPGARGALWECYGSSEWDGAVTRHAGNVSREEYVSSMASHRFALCPRGNGIDTHRMWESLYVGTIPVVERDQALDSFSDLPILFVDRLDGLSRGYLEATYQEMILKHWNWEKLFLPWWRDRFEQEREKIGGRVPWLEYWRQKGFDALHWDEGIRSPQ